MFLQTNQSKPLLSTSTLYPLVLCLLVFACVIITRSDCSGPLWEHIGMFVFACSAYINVPICVLAGGSARIRKGEACRDAVLLLLCLECFPCGHYKRYNTLLKRCVSPVWTCLWTAPGYNANEAHMWTGDSYLFVVSDMLLSAPLISSSTTAAVLWTPACVYEHIIYDL